MRAGSRQPSFYVLTVCPGPAVSPSGIAPRHHPLASPHGIALPHHPAASPAASPHGIAPHTPLARVLLQGGDAAGNSVGNRQSLAVLPA